MARNNEANLMGLGIKIAIGFAVLIGGGILVANTMTSVDADEIVVKQDFVGGDLHVWDTSGTKFQNFGTITRYKRSAQLWFSAKDNGKKQPEGDDKDKKPIADDSIKVRFSDGGHGNISGSLRYNLPTDPNKMILLHRTYHNMDAIDHELVRQVVNKGVYMSGPLMSSRESYAEKRADLINYITDQIVYGVYRTEHEAVKVVDPLTQQERVVDLVHPKINNGSPNGIEREEESPLQKFGMNASNITISSIDYDEVVEKQIRQQQESIMAVQQAIVDSKRAEQATLTVEQQGKANAAKAKWDQEVEKATAVTSAEKDKAVAETQAEKDKAVAALALDTAKLNAQQTVTSARADADAKRLAMQSNNYFLERLDAWKEVAVAQANAIGNQRQTPDVVLGAGGSGAGNTAALLGLLTARTARDFNVSPKP
jgi:regulator of protease activity HflC (stomatin/prohibitin superfamily)